jgi:hypothetical protein
MVVGLSLSLFAPLATAADGSKGDSFNYIINSGNAGPNSGIAALSTAYQIEPDQTDFKFDECKWEQDFKMLQAASTKIIDPGCEGQDAYNIEESYGKIISSSPNLITNPFITRDEAAEGLTGGSPVNNPDDKKISDVAVDTAVALARMIISSANPTMTFTNRLLTVVQCLAPVFKLTGGERWVVTFDHLTGSLQAPASLSSHYITFETFTQGNTDQITTPGAPPKSINSKEALVRAGTKPAQFTYESGVVVHGSAVKYTAKQTFVFVRDRIPSGHDPTTETQYSFHLSHENFERTRSSAPTMSLGDDFEHVLDTWGEP